MERPEGILFDFDGTLAPNLDLPEMKRQLIEMTLESGVPQPEVEGRLIVELAEHAENWLSVSNPDEARAYRLRADQLILEFELEAARTTQLFPGMRELLSQIRARGVAIGIVTRNCEAAVRIMFDDVDEFCAALLTRDRVVHLKPDPRHLTLALEQLNCSAKASMMVGDGRLDMMAGVQLGMYCVGVLSGGTSRAALQQAGAELILEGAADLTRSGVIV
ncbi:MAG: HAD family hydrolase [bacterium]|nr:HAD family hydrolase [bacterium]